MGVGQKRRTGGEDGNESEDNLKEKDNDKLEGIKTGVAV